MGLKHEKELRRLIECVGNDKNFVEYVEELKKKRDEILSRKDFEGNLSRHNALGHKIRYLIYNLIKQKEICICELNAILDLTQSTISHHVKILEQAGLIIGIKSGKFTHYQIKKEID